MHSARCARRLVNTGWSTSPTPQAWPAGAPAAAPLVQPPLPSTPTTPSVAAASSSSFPVSMVILVVLIVAAGSAAVGIVLGVLVHRRRRARGVRARLDAAMDVWDEHDDDEIDDDGSAAQKQGLLQSASGAQDRVRRMRARMVDSSYTAMQGETGVLVSAFEAPAMQPWSDASSANRSRQSTGTQCSSIVSEYCCTTTGTSSRRPIDLFRNSVQPARPAKHASTLSVEMSQRSWILLPSEVQLLTRPDGSEWCLGRGAYGEVFRGLMAGTIPVAVKYMLTDVGDQESVVQAIVKEISLLRVCRKVFVPIYF